MSQLNGMRFVLEKLRVKVRQKHLDLLAKGTTPQADDMDGPQFWGELEKFGDQLALMLRNLGSMASSLEGEADRARFAPHAYRYSANQSVRDRQRNVQNVMELALEIAGDLRDLHGRAQAPTETDLIKGVESIMKDVGKAIDQALVQSTVKQITNEPGFHGMTQASPSFGSMASLPVLVMAIIFMIRGKVRQRARQRA